MATRKPVDPVPQLIRCGDVPNWGGSSVQGADLNEAELIEPAASRKTPVQPEWMRHDNFAALLARGPFQVPDALEQLNDELDAPSSGDTIRGSRLYR